MYVHPLVCPICISLMYSDFPLFWGVLLKSVAVRTVSFSAPIWPPPCCTQFNSPIPPTPVSPSVRTYHLLSVVRLYTPPWPSLWCPPLTPHVLPTRCPPPPLAGLQCPPRAFSNHPPVRLLSARVSSPPRHQSFAVTGALPKPPPYG